MSAKSGYLAKQREREAALQMATRQTFEQYMTDTLLLTLNDPDVMGSDTFGAVRLKRVLAGWAKTYDKYLDAITRCDEADYTREKMDEAIIQIFGNDDADFMLFSERYKYLRDISYSK